MPLKNELAVMFWAGKDPAATLSELQKMGLHAGQMGIPGDFDLGAPELWKDALAAAHFRVYTVFVAYDGESYADIPTVAHTVGLVPKVTREARERRTEAVSRFAHALGVSMIATHIGFVPEDREDPEYRAMVELVRRICDFAAAFQQKFAMETGQEPAVALKRFLQDVDRPNIGINFDPANMILYGTGDPIEALTVLGSEVISVHCKDGNWPTPGVKGALGEEQPLGSGAVDFPRFLQKLDEAGYRGPLAIEREASDPERRLRDIRGAVSFLQKIELSVT